MIKSRNRKIFALALALVMVMSMGVMAFADIGDSVSNALMDASRILIKIVNPIAILCVMGCGLYCVMGDDPANLKKAKTWGIAIFVGLIIINAAEPIVSAIQSLSAASN